MAVATLAVAPATWWVSKPVLGRPAGTDRMITPPDWLVAAEHVVGASAVLVVAAGIRVFDALAPASPRRVRW